MHGPKILVGFRFIMTWKLNFGTAVVPKRCIHQLRYIGDPVLRRSCQKVDWETDRELVNEVVQTFRKIMIEKSHIMSRFLGIFVG